MKKSLKLISFMILPLSFSLCLFSTTSCSKESISYALSNSDGTTSSNISYQGTLTITVSSKVATGDYSWSGFADHDGIDLKVSGTNSDILKIHNNSSAFADIDFSNINVTNDGFTRKIKKISCKQEETIISYNLSSPYIYYGDTLVITASGVHIDDDFLWSGFESANGITFSVNGTKKNTLTIVNNNSTQKNIHFPDIKIKNNGVTKDVQLIYCLTGAATYELDNDDHTSSPVIAYDYNLRIRILPENYGWVSWGGYNANNGITFSQEDGTYNLSLIIENRNTTDQPISFSGITYTIFGITRTISETVVCNPQ